jgi:hypothetical protein
MIFGIIVGFVSGFFLACFFVGLLIEQRAKDGKILLDHFKVIDAHKDR